MSWLKLYQLNLEYTKLLEMYVQDSETKLRKGVNQTNPIYMRAIRRSILERYLKEKSKIVKTLSTCARRCYVANVMKDCDVCKDAYKKEVAEHLDWRYGKGTGKRFYEILKEKEKPVDLPQWVLVANDLKKTSPENRFIEHEELIRELLELPIPTDEAPEELDCNAISQWYGEQSTSTAAEPPGSSSQESHIPRGKDWWKLDPVGEQYTLPKSNPTVTGEPNIVSPKQKNDDHEMAGCSSQVAGPAYLTADYSTETDLQGDGKIEQGCQTDDWDGEQA